MKKTTAFVILSAMVTPLLNVPATAQSSEPRLLGTYGVWQTYQRDEGQQRICYALSQPKSKSPNSVNHGDIYFMVSNWRSGAAIEQPSFLAGFSLKTTEPPSTRVGNASTPMYVSQNEAFVEDNNDERRLVKNMRDGSTMRVDAVSTRGTSVSYSFSLKGVTAALQRSKQACG